MNSFDLAIYHGAKDNLLSKLMHIPKADREKIIDELIQDLKWMKEGRLLGP